MMANIPRDEDETMYQIELVGGTTSTCDTYAAAIAVVRLEYPDAVTSHDGDLSDGGDRTLCWADADDADNDDGAKAIASITRVHDADD